MISYFRFDKYHISLIQDAFKHIPFMIFPSEVNRDNGIYFSRKEMEEMNIPKEDQYQTFRMIQSTHIAVIPSSFQEQAELYELLAGLKIRWIKINQPMGKYTTEYAYETAGGGLVFKLYGRKQQNFVAGSVVI